MRNNFSIFCKSGFPRVKGIQFCLLIISTFLLIACGGGAGTVGISTGTALYTTAPASISVPVSQNTYNIGGGTAPYKTSSSSPQIASSEVKGSTLTVKALAAGTANIAVTDATGASISISVTVTASGTTNQAFFTTAPESITIANNGAASFTISGGKPGYMISSSNTAVATVGMNGTSFFIAGISTGSAQVVVFDSTGTSINISVTVGSGTQASKPALYVTSASTITFVPNEVNTYQIGGGTPPYIVSSNNTNVASASVTGSALKVTGVSKGSAQISVFDASGTSVNLTATVDAPDSTTVPLFVTAPSTISMAIGKQNSFTISGGKAPYTVSSSNNNVATASLLGSLITISSVASGSAQVVIFDATGTSVSITTAVAPTDTTVSLYSTATNAISLSVGTTSTYTIGGGTPPYSVSSNNINVAIASNNTNSLKITGLNKGNALISVFDSQGTSISISTTIDSVEVAVPLFVTAPSSISITVGKQYQYVVGGGVAPYAVSSSNFGVSTATILNNNLSINGNAVGAAQILVTDARGATIGVAISVGSNTSATNLYTTAPNSITLAANSIALFSVAGGTPPYQVSSSNLLVANASLSANTLTVSGIAKGNAQISIFDSTGSSVNFSTTIETADVAIPLFVTAPNTISIGTGKQSTFTVSGGKPPYTGTSSNISVAKINLTNNLATISGDATGNAQVLIFDSSGTSISIALTVEPTTTYYPLYTTAAGSISIPINTVASYIIGGGSPPYRVSSSSPAIATASVIGSIFNVNSLTAGTAKISIFDTTGALLTIDLTTTPPPIIGIETQPNSAAGNVGDSLQFQVSGGTPPYGITINNGSIATITTPTVGSSGGSIFATLLNAGSTNISIIDSLGQTKSIALTVNQQSALLRLSPNQIVIAEDNIEGIKLNIFGGAGPYRAFTSDQALTSVSVVGSTLTVGLGTNANRCINPIDTSGVRVPFATFDVTITVIDSLGASATTTLSIKDNGIGSGALPSQATPFNPPCL